MGRGNRGALAQRPAHDLARNAWAHRTLRRLPGPLRHRPSSGAGRDAGHHRRQRRGQIDIPQDHRGAAGRRTPKRCLDGRPIGGLPAPQIVRLGISLVPEGRRLFPSLSVEENLQIGAYGRHDGRLLDARRASTSCSPRWPSAARAPSQTLSGGQQQMAAIGRALMANPRVLLCDEISLGLAPDRHPRHLRGAAAHQGERGQRHPGRAGHRAGAAGGRPGLLLPGGPDVADGHARGAQPRRRSTPRISAHDRRLARHRRCRA